MDLLLIALTPIIFAQMKQRHLKAKREAIFRRANRMLWRNGGLTRKACEELWSNLLAAHLRDPGSHEVSRLLNEFSTRLRLLVELVGNGKQRDRRIFLGRVTRADLNGPLNDLARVLKAHGVRLIAPHGEATDGKRLLYVVAMPTVNQPMGSLSTTATSRPAPLPTATPERVLN